MSAVFLVRKLVTIRVLCRSLSETGCAIRNTNYWLQREKVIKFRMAVTCQLEPRGTFTGAESPGFQPA